MVTTTTTIPMANISGLLDAATYANTATGGMFWNYFVITFWGVVFLMSKAFSSERGVLIASFLAALLSFPLAVAGQVSFTFVLVFGVMSAAGAVMSV